MTGDFSKSEILKIMLKAEAMWKDSRHEAEFTPQAEAARAVLANQTARFQALRDRDKDNLMRVTFINACAITDEDCESNCVIGGDELESGAKDYEIDICRKADFSIDAEKSRTNTYEVEEIAARGQAMATKKLDEFWAKQVLAKMKSFAGINVAPLPFVFDNSNKTTNVPAANYNVKIVANMLQQAQLNLMGTPYFVDRGSLFLEWLNSQLDGGNLDGRGDVNRVAQLKMYFDQFNFAGAGVTEDTFMISPGAMAFQTANRNPDAPTWIGGKVQKMVYTIPSIALPGVRYDAYYDLDCRTVNGKAHIFHNWRFETNGGIWLNPEGCPIDVNGTTYTPTGVLSYTKV